MDDGLVWSPYVASSIVAQAEGMLGGVGGFAASQGPSRERSAGPPDTTDAFPAD